MKETLNIFSREVLIVKYLAPRIMEDGQKEMDDIAKPLQSHVIWGKSRKV